VIDREPLLTPGEVAALFRVDEFLPVPGVSESFAARVFSKVEVTTGCWYWHGAVSPKGYGVIGRGVRGAGNMAAHSAVWQLLVGPIPESLTFDHLCRNHPCVNPEHGEIVTRGENIRRGFGMSTRHRLRATCRRGHLKDGMTGARGGRRHRYCKTCARAKSAARYHRLRSAA
jgi:hypothetical protein